MQIITCVYFDLIFTHGTFHHINMQILIIYCIKAYVFQK